jgi:hypothetical protein
VNVKPPIIGASNGCSNDAEMGRVLAYYFVSDSGGKGNAVMEHVAAYPVLTAFTSAFISTTKLLCPSCKTQLVNITIPDLAAGKIPSRMVSALKTNPDANYLVFDYGPFAEGINSALNAAGLGGKVKIIGQAADAGAIAALKNGTQAAWTGFDPGYQPYAMFDAMFRDQEGLPIDQTQQALQPTQILTKSNINSVNIQNGFWSEPADTPAQFKALWHMQQAAGLGRSLIRCGGVTNVAPPRSIGGDLGVHRRKPHLYRDRGPGPGRAPLVGPISSRAVAGVLLRPLEHASHDRWRACRLPDACGVGGARRGVSDRDHPASG